MPGLRSSVGAASGLERSVLALGGTGAVSRWNALTVTLDVLNRLAGVDTTFPWTHASQQGRDMAIDVGRAWRWLRGSHALDQPGCMTAWLGG